MIFSLFSFALIISFYKILTTKYMVFRYTEFVDSYCVTDRVVGLRDSSRITDTFYSVLNSKWLLGEEKEMSYTYNALSA